jgi:hypothetical protein
MLSGYLFHEDVSLFPFFFQIFFSFDSRRHSILLYMNLNASKKKDWHTSYFSLKKNALFGITPLQPTTLVNLN